MNSGAPPIFDHMVTGDGRNLRCAVVDIGAWAMKTVSQKFVTLPGYITMSKVVSASGFVVSDDNTDYRPSANGETVNTLNMGWGVWRITAGDIILRVLATSDFVTTNGWAGGVNNRGRLLIWYID